MDDSAGRVAAMAAIEELRGPAGLAPARAGEEDVRQLTADNDAFGARLLETVASPRDTAVISPLSVSEALAMTLAGARGETAAQITEAVSLRLPAERLHPAFNALDHSLSALEGPGVTLNVANGLFGQRGMAFREEFLSLLAREYGAGMQTVDFAAAPEPARLAIDQWVSDRTRGKIPSLLGEGSVGKDTRLVLVNAVYLNAKWLVPFRPESTHPAPFHGPSGTVKVPTMSRTGQFGYRQVDDYQAVELVYEGERLVFDVLLPDPGAMQSLLSRLIAERIGAMLTELEPERVELSLPKLELRARFSPLNDALAQLGMPLAFTDQADLSGIAGNQGDLYIGSVAHETYVRVDEQGTEAAAATGVTAVASAMSLQRPRELKIDRPFVFAIRDRTTGATLFLGLVSQP